MSPSRTRKPVAKLRPRSEVVIAVLVAVGIVGGTVLLIWLLRPGSPGDDSTGGLMTRQSRVWLLLFLTLAALAGAIAWLLRGRRRPRNLSPRVTVTIATVIVAVGGVVAGVLWPGGLVHHWPPQPKSEPTSNTTPDVTNPPPPPPTTAAKSTVGSTKAKPEPRAATPTTSKGK